MLEIRNLEVKTFDLDHLDITWTVADTAEEVERYEFYLFRSVDGPVGYFKRLAGPFNTSGWFRDPDVSLLNKWRDYFYKLQVINKDTGQELEIGPEWLRAKPDRIALEIQRRMYLVLKEYNGVPCLLFPAITSGHRCPNCWDNGPRGNSLGRPTKQNCQTCYDTSFVNGYMRPILFWIQIDPAPASPQQMDVTVRAAVNTTARTSAFPPLKPNDVIVTAQNYRWNVERVPVTRKLNAIVHQEPVLHGIPKPDIRYTLPIPEDLLTKLTNREYTRPMTTLGN